MSDVVTTRFDLCNHVTGAAECIAKETTLTAKQAYGMLMAYVNALEDANKPEPNILEGVGE